MHLHALQRNTHYLASNSTSITRRSTDTNNIKIWAIIGPIIITLITLVLVVLLILFLKYRLSTRRVNHTAQGELAHFQTGSVRRTNRRPSPGVQKRPATSAFVGRPPLPDPDHFEMYDLGIITKPGFSYAREWNRPGHGQEVQVGNDIGRPAHTHVPAQVGRGLDREGELGQSSAV